MIYGKRMTDLGDCFGLKFRNKKSLLNYRDKILNYATRTNFGGDPYQSASWIETKDFLFTFDIDKLAIYANKVKDEK